MRYMRKIYFHHSMRCALGVNDEHCTDKSLKVVSGKRLTNRRTDAQLQEVVTHV